MRFLMINVVCGIRSTGRICTDLATAIEAHGHEVKIVYGRENVPDQYRKYAVRIGTDLDVRMHAAKARLFDDCGFGSRKVTEKFIEWVKEYDPDVIHLHNIHGYYINIEVLFSYLRSCGKMIIWTLHDCWPFTGHAAYCEAADCERWLTGCYDCPKKNDYPTAFFDYSKHNWERKKQLFCGIPNLWLVSPSEWLAKLISKSFLCKYPVVMIHNGVNTSVFKKTPSDIIERKGLPTNKKVILGVAALWEKRKGLYDFYKLADVLGNNYQIMLVGLSKKQILALPPQIIGIEKTNSLNELVEFYSAADFYVNPTYEDNYPTTNLESIACGTPVITYNTGGSGESASIYGKVVKKHDIEEMAIEIETSTPICKTVDISINEMVRRYMRLYNRDEAK